MLPSVHRIPSHEIVPLLRYGRRIHTLELVLVYKKNTIGVNRFAVVVSVKVSRLATVRNRIRRLISESIRHLLPSVPGSVDGIVIARKNIADRKQEEVQSMIDGLLKKI